MDCRIATAASIGREKSVRAHSRGIALAQKVPSRSDRPEGSDHVETGRKGVAGGGKKVERCQGGTTWMDEEGDSASLGEGC